MQARENPTNVLAQKTLENTLKTLLVPMIVAKMAVADMEITVRQSILPLVGSTTLYPPFLFSSLSKASAKNEINKATIRMQKASSFLLFSDKRRPRRPTGRARRDNIRGR
jgi:hypothetical protein